MSFKEYLKNLLECKANTALTYFIGGVIFATSAAINAIPKGVSKMQPTRIYQTTINGTNYLAVINRSREAYPFVQIPNLPEEWIRLDEDLAQHRQYRSTDAKILETRAKEADDSLVKRVLSAPEGGKIK